MRHQLARAELGVLGGNRARLDQRLLVGGSWVPASPHILLSRSYRPGRRHAPGRTRVVVSASGTHPAHEQRRWPRSPRREPLQSNRSWLAPLFRQCGEVAASRLFPDQVQNELHGRRPLLLCKRIGSALFQDVFVGPGKRFRYGLLRQSRIGTPPGSKCVARRRFASNRATENPGLLSTAMPVPYRQRVSAMKSGYPRFGQVSARSSIRRGLVGSARVSGDDSVARRATDGSQPWRRGAPRVRNRTGQIARGCHDRGLGAGGFLPRSLATNDLVKLAPLNPAAYWPARRVRLRMTALRVGPLRMDDPERNSPDSQLLDTSIRAMARKPVGRA